MNITIVRRRMGCYPPVSTVTKSEADMVITVPSAAWVPRMLSVLRVMTGLLFLEHGTQKLFSFPVHIGTGPALMSLLGLQGCLELVGGLMITAGLFTRPVAFILAGDMAAAYFHDPHAKELFPGPERRRRCHFVLLRVPVHGRGRRRSVVPRCAAEFLTPRPAAPNPRGPVGWQKSAGNGARRHEVMALPSGDVERGGFTPPPWGHSPTG
jgi:putative oxidoreductase